MKHHRGRRWLYALLLVVLFRPSLAWSADINVLVLYFDNNTTDREYDVLQKGLADMMITDLSMVDGLQVVEREKLDSLVSELKLQESRFFDKKTALKMGKGVGAEYAVTGAFVAFDPKLRIDIRLVEVATGKVVLSAKVIGRKDQILDLQQELLKRFVSGMNRTLGRRAEASKEVDLATVLAYSQALEKADKGEFKDASKTLGAIVSKSPDFKLAQTRYMEVLRSLSKARKKRNTVQIQNLQFVLKRVNFLLKDTDHTKLRWPADMKYYSYRAVRGQIMLELLKAVTGPKNDDDFRPVQRLMRKEAIDLMTAYLENSFTLREEIVTVRGERNDSKTPSASGDFFSMDDAVIKGTGIKSPGHWWGRMTPSEIDCNMAEFILTGEAAPYDFFNDIKVTPSLAALDPAMRQKADELLARAISDTDKHNPHFLQMELVASTYDCVAKVLEKTGKKAQAIARWQSILDRFPNIDDFDDYEEKIKDALGIDDD